MDEGSVAEASETVVEPIVEPSEPVIIKKRGRPKGSLNKKTIAKMREDVLPEIAPEPELEALPTMVLDVDFTSDEILGEKPQASQVSEKKTPSNSQDKGSPDRAAI